MSAEVDVQELVAGLFRVRIPTIRAHLLNCYLWLGTEGAAVVDTGWPDSALVLAQALQQLDRKTNDVERIVLSHFHDDHMGSATQVAEWLSSTVVAGRQDAPSSAASGLDPGQH